MNVHAHEKAAHVQRLARDFRTAAKQPANLALAQSLILEEAKEFLQSAEVLRSFRTHEHMQEFLKETVDLLYVMAGMIEQADVLGAEEGRRQVEANEEVAITLMIVLPVAENILTQAMGVFLEESIIDRAVERVHASNLTKIGPNGVEFREDGKVLKPATYVAPDLSDLAQEALANWSEFERRAQEALEEAV